MKTKIFLPIILFSFLIGSCKKEDPKVPQGNAPVFTFSGNINGSPVNFQAGVNNYYMYTSYTQDVNNVYNFMGDLKPYNCTNCTNRLQLQINDFQSLTVGAPAAINTALIPGYYAFQIPGGTPTQYNISFTSFSYNVTPQSWAWDFGDGTTSTQQSPAHTYTHPGNYTACVTTTFSDLTTGSSCNPVYIGTPESGCTGNFTYTATVNTVSFTPSAFGSGGYAYSWDFGDGATSISSAPVHTYTASGLYLVSMKITDSQNHILVYNRNVPTQFYPGSVAGMYFLGTNNTNPNPNALSNTTISWTDASGTVYTSNNALQPATSYFKVISVDPYSNNSLGQTTKKVHAQLKCTLYNGTSTLLLDNCDLVFGVAYH